MKQIPQEEAETLCDIATLTTLLKRDYVSREDIPAEFQGFVPPNAQGFTNEQYAAWFDHLVHGAD